MRWQFSDCKIVVDKQSVSNCLRFLRRAGVSLRRSNCWELAVAAQKANEAPLGVPRFESAIPWGEEEPSGPSITAGLATEQATASKTRGAEKTRAKKREAAGLRGWGRYDLGASGECLN